MFNSATLSNLIPAPSTTPFWCMEAGGTAPRTLDLHAGKKWTVTFTPWLLYLREKSHRHHHHPSDRRMDGSCRCESDGNKKIPMSIPGIEFWLTIHDPLCLLFCDDDNYNQSHRAQSLSLSLLPVYWPRNSPPFIEPEEKRQWLLWTNQTLQIGSRAREWPPHVIKKTITVWVRELAPTSSGTTVVIP